MATTQLLPTPDPVARATQMFASGVSCAPAVFAAVAPQLGMAEDPAARIACCFGGGMIGSGKTCGAVTGAMMALGLKHGSGSAPAPAKKQAAYEKVAELWRRFSEKHGSISCQGILGVDISTPEGRAKAEADGLFKTRCPSVVRDATEILVSLL
jgi:C_GCAxxG_C_C family probable redox protein